MWHVYLEIHPSESEAKPKEPSFSSTLYLAALGNLTWPFFPDAKLQPGSKGLCGWPQLFKRLTLKDNLSACVTVVEPWFTTHSLWEEEQRAVRLLSMNITGVEWLSWGEQDAFQDLDFYVFAFMEFVPFLKSIISSLSPLLLNFLSRFSPLSRLNISYTILKTSVWEWETLLRWNPELCYSLLKQHSRTAQCCVSVCKINVSASWPKAGSFSGTLILGC